MIAELFVTIARKIQYFSGSEQWMEKLKAVPNEEEFREWEALQIAEIIADHIKLVKPPDQSGQT